MAPHWPPALLEVVCGGNSLAYTVTCMAASIVSSRRGLETREHRDPVERLAPRWHGWTAWSEGRSGRCRAGGGRRRQRRSGRSWAARTHWRDGARGAAGAQGRGWHGWNAWTARPEGFFSFFLFRSARSGAARTTWPGRASRDRGRTGSAREGARRPRESVLRHGRDHDQRLLRGRQHDAAHGRNDRRAVRRRPQRESGRELRNQIRTFEARDRELPTSLSSSQLGQRGALFNERLDLMIDGKSRNDLEMYRTTLLEKGLSVDAIAQDQLFGHDYCQFADPDGNGITVYTSHAGELSV